MERQLKYIRDQLMRQLSFDDSDIRVPKENHQNSGRDQFSDEISLTDVNMSDK